MPSENYNPSYVPESKQFSSSWGWRMGLFGLLVGCFMLVLAVLIIQPESEPVVMPLISAAATPTPGSTPRPTHTATQVTPSSGPSQTASPTHTIIPPPTLTPTPSKTPWVIQRHTVQDGETLLRIANQYGVTLERLMEVNHIAAADFIFVGQILIIPFVGEHELPAALLTAAAPPYQIIILGHSTQGRPIERYTFGNGPAHLVFIGGIHGGYEWNSTTLAYQVIDYLTAFPKRIPETITLHIIPTANPDGLFLVAGKEDRVTSLDIPSVDPLAALPGRFNANQVDLNRNWDCDWSANAFWRNQPISGGTSPFSEVETQVLRDFLLGTGVQGVIFWHSAAALVIPGQCNDEPHLPSQTLAAAYRQASGYGHSSTLAYPITGDAADWLTRQGISAITVELRNHFDTDWPENLAGVLAVLALFQESHGE